MPKIRLSRVFSRFCEEKQRPEPSLRPRPCSGAGLNGEPKGPPKSRTYAKAVPGRVLFSCSENVTENSEFGRPLKPQK